MGSPSVSDLEAWARGHRLAAVGTGAGVVAAITGILLVRGAGQPAAIAATPIPTVSSGGGTDPAALGGTGGGSFFDPGLPPAGALPVDGGTSTLPAPTGPVMQPHPAGEKGWYDSGGYWHKNLNQGGGAPSGWSILPTPAPTSVAPTTTGTAGTRKPATPVKVAPPGPPPKSITIAAIMARSRAVTGHNPTLAQAKATQARDIAARAH